MENSDAIKKIGPRDIFFQLAGIITLYLAAINLGILLFQYINIYFPDVLGARYPFQVFQYYNLVRWAVATLIIIFPVFVWLNWFLEKEMRLFPEKREMKTRKWLLYLTLFVAAGVIVGDLISLIYNFLQGELTGRFALKMLVILLIASSVFVYYLRRLKQKSDQVFEKWEKIFIWSVVFLVAVAVIAGFFVAGSPQKERERKLDQQRISDLQNIQSQIVFFWQQKNRLPSDLDELTDNISGYVSPRDPETNASYEYVALDSLKFKLCASFKAPGEALEQPAMVEPGGSAIDVSQSWQHQAGHVCFERTIDQEIYKLKKD